MVCTPPFYIKSNSCHNCCRCLRDCVVNAIKYENGGASILLNRCIDCGMCYEVCPADAVVIDSHIPTARRVIKHNDVIVASLSPLWVSEFPGIEPSRMVEALKLLGFTYVSETTLGADKLFEEAGKRMAETPGLYISSVCPVVNSLINKYHHSLIDNLLPLDTPSIVHAKMIKQWYGNEAKVITIGSCAAAKREVCDFPELIDAALTFKELKEWMAVEGIRFDFIPGNPSYRFEPIPAKGLTEYVIAGKVMTGDRLKKHGLSDIQIIEASGIDRVKKMLSFLEKERIIDKPFYFELFACEEGCIQGVGAIDKSTYIEKRSSLLQYADYNKTKGAYPKYPHVLISKKFESENVSLPLSNQDIVEVLRKISEDLAQEPVNCGGCGFASCRDFAIALIGGNVREEQCIWHQKQILQDEFSAILQQIPFGVFIVNKYMRIEEANKNFAVLAGAEAEMVYDTNPGMHAVDITRFISFDGLSAMMQENGEDFLEKELQVKGKMLKLTLFTIQNRKLVCGFVRNLFLQDVRNDEIVARARAVINDNLETVQKIAYLLGESASRTEAILNSILESQTDSDEQ